MSLSKAERKYWLEKMEKELLIASHKQGTLRKIQVVVYWAIICETCVLLDCLKSHLPLPRNFMIGVKLKIGWNPKIPELKDTAEVITNSQG